MKRKFRSYALFRLDVDLAVNGLDGAFDDIHADSSAGLVTHFGGRREARQIDQIDDIGVSHRRGTLRPENADGDRLRFDFFDIKSRPIVFHLDHHGATSVCRAQVDRASGLLAARHASFGRFDSVI